MCHHDLLAGVPPQALGRSHVDRAFHEVLHSPSNRNDRNQALRFGAQPVLDLGRYLTIVLSVSQAELRQFPCVLVTPALEAMVAVSRGVLGTRRLF